MDYLTQVGVNAKTAQKAMRKISTAKKNEVLLAIADALEANAMTIIEANAIDMERGRQNGMPGGLLDRLKLDASRIGAMADGLRQVAALNDPIGSMDSVNVRPNGLKIGKQRVPLGVIGIIYEARPNVTTDAFGLCFKSGNVSILRGGSDAANSNAAIVTVVRDTLKSCEIDENVLQLLENTDHDSLKAFMQMTQYVDLLIPRGGAGLIRSVVENATVPVIETGVGNCHIFVDESADIDMAINIIYNAKTQRIGVCNACESLVIHEKIVDKLLPALKEKLDTKQVEIHADEAVLCALGQADNDEVALSRLNLKKATDEDWGKEYLDYVISAKTVSSIDEAIDHINFYNTGHSEAIITNDYANASRFTNEIDAAAVYVNASTRFTDGNEFGFGAEIGISTQKLHARGPMGLDALTTTKYVIFGNGQVRA